jgi:hypothetical protein
LEEGEIVAGYMLHPKKLAGSWEADSSSTCHKTYLQFMKPEGSLPRSQHPATT